MKFTNTDCVHGRVRHPATEWNGSYEVKYWQLHQCLRIQVRWEIGIHFFPILIKITQEFKK